MATLKNQHGETVVKLEADGFGYFELPHGFCFDCLAIGDTYTVVADEGDEDEED